MKKQAKQTAFGAKFFNFRLFLEAVKRLRVVGIAVAILALTTALLIPTVTWVSEESRSENHGNWVVIPAETDEGGIVSKYEEVWVPKEIEPQPVDAYLLCIPLYVLPFLAPFFFFVLFSFLHKRKQSDFYHAIPYTRTCVYVSFVTAALAFIFLIQIASALISGAIYAACPYTTFEFSDLASTMGISMLSAAFLSAFMMLALALTGTPATTALLFALFASITRIVLALFSLMVSELLIVSSNFYPFLSYYWHLPIRMFIQRGDYYYYDEAVPSYGVLIPYTIVVTLIIFAAAGLFYKLRRSEMAERSAPSRTLQSIFRCLFTLPFALLLVTMLVMGEIEFELFIILLTVIIVVFYLYELITTKRPKNMLKATPWLGVVAAGAAVFFGAYLTFFYTVHREIPEEKVLSVAVQVDGASTFESINTANIMTEDEDMISLVTDALEYTRNCVLHGRPYDYSHETRYHDVTIRQTNGITLKRTLMFTPEAQEELSVYLAESEEYSEHFLALPAFDTITALNAYSNYTNRHFGVYFNKNEQALSDFWEIFSAEYNALSLEDKLIFKEGGDIREESASTEKEESVVFPDSSHVSVEAYGAFHIRMNIQGTTEDGFRYYSDYSLPSSMTKTITYLIERMSAEEYSEYVNEEKLDENGKTTYLSTDDKISTEAMAQTVFEDIAAGTLSFTEGELQLSPYGKHELTLHIAAHTNDYAEFFTLLAEYVETKRERREGASPVLISIDMEKYANNVFIARADVGTYMYLTDEEYDALLTAAYITPFE